MIPPSVPCSLHPMYVATCCASGPGSSMQKFNVRRYCPSETQCFLSTNSLCMIAIWPAGPPKLINPSLTQNQKASQNLTSFSSAPYLSPQILLSSQPHTVTMVTPEVKQR